MSQLFGVNHITDCNGRCWATIIVVRPLPYTCSIAVFVRQVNQMLWAAHFPSAASGDHLSGKLAGLPRFAPFASGAGFLVGVFLMEI